MYAFEIYFLARSECELFQKKRPGDPALKFRFYFLWNDIRSA